MRWLGVAKVAERIDATPRQVRERYALLPDFPVPSRPGGNGHAKWREDEIDEWMERWKPKAASRSVPPSPGSTSSESADLDGQQSEPA